jgi:hypothetical protein
LIGGEWKTLWRLDGASASYVVSLSHPTITVESIAYEHRLLHYLHAELSQVPAPLLARNGSSYFIKQGQIINLFPWMPASSFFLIQPLSVGPLSVGPLSVGPLSVGPLSVGPLSVGTFFPTRLGQSLMTIEQRFCYTTLRHPLSCYSPLSCTTW